ncbi:hypothetical protein LCGC14_0295380 [marine sediment metagenome]|uniref:Uncharacterized protein n=1 Tax=marine sediment metagenome TaxID=412755 RepID=A0A0F9TS80_9ZZZZ
MTKQEETRRDILSDEEEMSEVYRSLRKWLRQGNSLESWSWVDKNPFPHDSIRKRIWSKLSTLASWITPHRNGHDKG